MKNLFNISISQKNKYFLKTIATSISIGIMLIPLIMFLNNFDMSQKFIIKMMDYKIFIEINVVFLLGLFIYSLSYGIKNVINILQRWSYVHLSLATCLFFSYLSIYSSFYIIFSLVAILFFESLIKKYKKKSHGNDIINVYESRKDKANYLKKLLTQKEKKMILIDGEWGIGKTYFVREVLATKEIMDYHKISVDILLFNDKEQMIKNVIDEINKVLINEGIRSVSIKKYKKIIEATTEKFPIKISSLIEEETLDSIEKNLKSDIRKLKNQIVIIVDNLERMVDEDKIVDILGFLHKLNETLDYNTKIIVIAKSENLAKNVKYIEYLQKFFDYKLYLYGEDSGKIINEIRKNKEFMNQYSENSIIEEYLELLNVHAVAVDSVIESITKLNENEKFANYCLERLLSLKIKLNNPRNLERVANEIYKNSIEYKFIYSENGYYTEDIYKSQIIWVSIFKELLPINYLEISRMINYDFFEDKKQIREADISLFPLYFSKIFFENNPFHFEKHDLIEKAYIRLLSDKGKSYECDLIKLMDNIYNNKGLIYHKSNDYLECLVDFVEIYDVDNHGYEIYKNIMNNLFSHENNKVKIPIRALNNSKINDFDKLYLQEWKNDISRSIYVIPIEYNEFGKQDAYNKLLNCYEKDLKCFAVAYLKIDEIQDDFIINFKEQYENTIGKTFENYIELLDHMFEFFLDKNKDFFKVNLKMLEEKLKFLFMEKNIMEVNMKSFVELENLIITSKQPLNQDENPIKKRLEILENIKKQLYFMFYNLFTKLSISDIDFLKVSDYSTIRGILKELTFNQKQEIIEIIDESKKRGFLRVFDVRTALCCLGKNVGEYEGFSNYPFYNLFKQYKETWDEIPSDEYEYQDKMRVIDTIEEHLVEELCKYLGKEYSYFYLFTINLIVNRINENFKLSTNYTDVLMNRVERRIIN